MIYLVNVFSVVEIVFNMSAVTLNLRTSTAHVSTLKFKSSKQKPSEQLPNLTDEFTFLYKNKAVTSLYQAKTLEQQILAIRAVSKLVMEN